MKDEPLVSVVIPTYNSEDTLEVCLRSVCGQTYPNIEVMVVDSYSKDGTREIAEKLGIKVLTVRSKLLGARYEGLKESGGDYILLLDSDQILDTTSVARALLLFEEYDMLCLEEQSYETRTWIQRLFEADRLLLHGSAVTYIDPLEGALLARFYKRRVLEKAFEAIPKEIMPIVVAHDHAIIYHEACKISRKVGVMTNSVWHFEPSGLVELWRKNYRYGKTTKRLLEYGYYKNLLSKKVRFRKWVPNNWKMWLQSNLLLSLKAVPYEIGCWVG